MVVPCGLIHPAARPARAQPVSVPCRRPAAARQPRERKCLTIARPVDIACVLVGAALVLFMQGGFTALESGLVRAKNSINVAIKNFANFLVAASLFWLFGFGLMFGRSARELIGSSSFLFDSNSSFLVAFFVFQLGFIGTATTLISGAVAERMRFGGYVAFDFFV